MCRLRTLPRLAPACACPPEPSLVLPRSLLPQEHSVRHAASLSPWNLQPGCQYLGCFPVPAVSSWKGLLQTRPSKTRWPLHAWMVLSTWICVKQTSVPWKSVWYGREPPSQKGNHEAGGLCLVRRWHHSHLQAPAKFRLVCFPFCLGSVNVSSPCISAQHLPLPSAGVAAPAPASLGLCQAGTFCPAGSFLPLPCPPGRMGVFPPAQAAWVGVLVCVLFSQGQ